MFLFGGRSWRGESGRKYKFKCVLTKKGLPRSGVAGIYIFVRRRFVFLIEPLYVGKAADIRSRLLGHEKWGRAYWYYGATERYVLGHIETEEERRLVETDLIHSLKPRMNDVAIPTADHDHKAHAAETRRRFSVPFFGRRPQHA
jgi:hypothetical protein